MQLNLDKGKEAMQLNLDKMIEKAPASAMDDILFQAMVKYYNKAVNDYWDLRAIYQHLENMQWLARDAKTGVDNSMKDSEMYILVTEDLLAKLRKKQELVDFYAGLIKKRLNL